MVVHERIDYCLLGSNLDELDFFFVGLLPLLFLNHIHTFLYLGHEMCHIDSAGRDFPTFLVCLKECPKLKSNALVPMLNTGTISWLYLFC